MKTRSCRFLLVVLTACASSSPPPPDPAPTLPEPALATDATPEETLDKLAGERRFSGGADERTGIATAIDGVVEQMNVLIRGIARSKLTEANPVIETIRIDRKGDSLTITLDDRVYTAPLDGTPVDAKGILGDPVKLDVKVKKGKIEQRIRGEDGGRINTFALTKDGEMRLYVRIFSERLPEDLRYALSYRRSK